MTTLFSMLTKSPDLRHQAILKVGCQSGDCRWPLILPQGFVWVCIHSMGMYFITPEGTECICIDHSLSQSEQVYTNQSIATTSHLPSHVYSHA